MSLNGAGGCRLWGFSPAMELAAEAPDANVEPDTPLRILMICPSDARHVLKTAGARRGRGR